MRIPIILEIYKNELFKGNSLKKIGKSLKNYGEN